MRHPSEVLRVGDIVTVWVLEVDEKKKRIALTRKPPAIGEELGGIPAKDAKN